MLSLFTFFDRKFLLVWAGQFLSGLGAALSGFAASIWIYRHTGSVMEYSVALALMILPGIIVSPWLGVMVDRFDRLKIIYGANLAIIGCNLIISALLFHGLLQIKYLYALNATISVFHILLGVAYSASIGHWVTKNNLARANGLVQITAATSQILAPILASALLPMIGLLGIVNIDILLGIIAVGIFYVGHINYAASQEESVNAQPIPNLKNLWTDFHEGFDFLLSTRLLKILLGYFILENFLVNMMISLQFPLILSVYSESVLSIFISCAGIGGLVGAFLMAALNPARLITTVFIADALLGLAIAIAGLDIAVTVAGIPKSNVLLYFCAFSGSACLLLNEASEQSLWQRYVPLNMQGRIFSVKNAISSSFLPISALTGGFLSDYIFEPLLMPGGLLTHSVGEWLGTGKGRGTGLLSLMLGLVLLMLSLTAFLSRRLHELDTIHPDIFLDEKSNHF